MSDWAIKVENLSKLYRIGSRQKKPDTLLGSLNSIISSPVSNFRRLRELNHFNNLSDKNIFWALNDISFEVKKGEALGIVGHNGAGKSTLLKILSRITEPSFGQARVRGRISSLLEVGTGFHPELTGRDNIYMNGTILGMTKKEIDRKLDQIIHFSGVERHIDTLLKFYSSGMKVRLGFSVAAYMEQEIIIVDEVLAVGDAEFQKKCLGTMDNVTSQGRTILFVSHDLGAIRSLCKRSVLLNNGLLIKDGESSQVVSDYLELRNNNTVPISERKDRNGKGPVLLTDISLVDNTSNDFTKVLTSGSNISLLLSYKSIQQDPLNDIEIGIDLFTQNGEFVTAFNNRMATSNFSKLPGSGTIECNIENFSLMAGKYRLDIFLYSNGKYCDGVFDALDFDVTNRGYYKSGYSNANGKGGVYIQQNWELLNEPVQAE